MYEVDGEFGQVRLMGHLPTQTALRHYHYATAAGWHLCNEKYRVLADACDTWLLLLTTGGGGYLRLQGREHGLRAGFAAIIAPDQAREYGVPPGGSWEFYWIHCGGLGTPLLQHLQAVGPVFPMGERQREIGAAVEELMMLKNRQAPQFEVHASRIVGEVLHELLLGYEPGRAAPREAVRRLMSRLETGYWLPLSLKTISGELYLNPAHLSRLFKAQTGVTPQEYLKRLRIMKAKEMLRYTEWSVGEIARRAGFAHPSNFIHQFHRAEGVTPTQYRGGR